MKNVRKKSRQIMNQQGLTLVEVMVAIAILLLAAEIISVSVSFNARMNTKSRQIFKANEELGIKIQDKSLGKIGSMELDLNGTKITNSEDARLYSEDIAGDGGGSLRAMWTDDSVMTDFFELSGARAPELSIKPEFNLPQYFPDPSERGIDVFEPFCEEIEDGENGDSRIIFHNDNETLPSFAVMEGIEVRSSGSYTGTGISILEIHNLSFSAEPISMWLEAEVYHLSGEITCQYSDKYRGKDSIPIHLYLVPKSGHGQPALIYVEDGTRISYLCMSETVEVEDSRRMSYDIPEGWYAIPAGSGSETGTNAKDLLKLTEAEWGKYSLSGAANVDDNGAVDKAYARLILAGLIDKNSVTDGNSKE